MEVLAERHPHIRFAWLGSSHRMESRLIPSRGIGFIGLRQTELRRRPTPANILYNIRTLWFLLRSIFQSIGIVRKLKPCMVLNTGGFAAGAAGIAAWLTGTPLIIIEPNAYPGITNKWLGKRARLVFTAYPDANRFFPKDRIISTGAPARREIVAKDRNQARAELGITDEIMILAMGGSQGAKSINRLLPDAIKRVIQNKPDIRLRVIHQCGHEKSGNVDVDRTVLPQSIYQVIEFIDDVPTYLAAADIVISRAGASTLSEIGCRGLPSILIPYPRSSENHQVKNARAWEAAGAAICIEESELNPGSLGDRLSKLLNDPQKRAAMGEAAKQFGNPSAAEKIADRLDQFIRPYRVS